MAQLEPLSALRAGRLITLVDDEATEGGSELWLAAELAEASEFARLVRYTSGYVTVALPTHRCTALGLPPMAFVDSPQSECGTEQSVTCDAAEGISTGISAHDRALTSRLLADPGSTRDDLRRPGHIVPLRVRFGRSGVTSTAHAALELCTIAGLQPAMVRCELVRDDGALADAALGREIAAALRLPVVQLSELVPAAEGIALTA